MTQNTTFQSLDVDGLLEIRKAVIRFDPSEEYQNTLIVYDSSTLIIKGSTHIKSADIPWKGILSLDNANLIIEDSVVSHGDGIRFFGNSVSLKSSVFEYLKKGLFGNLLDNDGPVVENVTSRYNKIGLACMDDSDWKVTGAGTMIKGNTFDIVIGSSGDIYIPSSNYETSFILQGATGKVIHT